MTNELKIQNLLKKLNRSGVTNMNYTYFGNRIERSPLGNMGLQLLEAQQKYVSNEMRIYW